MARNGHDPETAMSSSHVFADGFELEKVADALSSYAAMLWNAGFAETARIVQIARLDLVSRINSITDEELQAVASAVSFERSVLRHRRQ